jgi:dTDP-4-dehydrorhamnose 3,5-epimerase
MQVATTGIEGLLVVTLDVYPDERGSFRETYQANKFGAAGFPLVVFTQTNVSVSCFGVIRGIHAEPWDKYVHAANGEIFSAIVDFRKDSPTFGKVETFHLDRTVALLVPAGCGNSFAALTDDAVYMYQVTGLFSSDTKYPAVAFDDPDLGVDWPIEPEYRIVSEKDRNNPSFKEAYGS